MLKEKIKLFNLKVWLKNHWKAAIILILLVVMAYTNGLKSDFVSDDTRSISQNESLDKISYFKQPRITFTMVSYFVINKIFWRNPVFYRLENIIFHTGTVLLTYLFFSILIDPKTAFFTAAILAVHPIQTESVTWISGGGYAQYAFFIILSLLFYVLSLRNKKLFIFSVISFALSLFTHDAAIVFPLIIFVFMLLFLDVRKNWKQLIPFFIISIIFALIYFGRIFYRIKSFEIDFYQKPQILNPLIQIPVAITSYLELIFWPGQLTLYHSEMTFSLIEYLARLTLFIIFLGVVIYSFRKNRYVFFGLSIFLISLLPTLTPLGITWIVAERYVYLGAIGIFMVFALFIKRLSQIKRLNIIINILFSLIIVALTARTIIRNIDWKNEDNLYIATAKTSPSSPNTHNNLGDVYSRQGKIEEAVAEFNKAIEMRPGYADAYHNLASTYKQAGRFDEAIENYQAAIRFNPRLWQSYSNLGALYFEKGNAELAEEYFKKAVEINPNDSNLYANLGVLYLLLNRKEEAKKNFQESLRVWPYNPRAIEGLKLLNQ